MGDLRCPSCRRISWDRSDGGALVALAFGNVVVLVDDDRRGPAAWVCGYCGDTVQAGSTLEEDLDVRTHRVAVRGE